MIAKGGMKDDFKLFLLNNYKWNRPVINWESSQHYLLLFIFIHSLRPCNLILLQALKINWTSKPLPVCLPCSILLLWSFRKLFFSLTSRPLAIILVWQKSLALHFFLITYLWPTSIDFFFVINKAMNLLIKILKLQC